MRKIIPRRLRALARLVRRERSERASSSEPTALAPPGMGYAGTFVTPKRHVPY